MKVHEDLEYENKDYDLADFSGTIQSQHDDTFDVKLTLGLGRSLYSQITGIVHGVKQEMFDEIPPTTTDVKFYFLEYKT